MSESVSSSQLLLAPQNSFFLAVRSFLSLLDFGEKLSTGAARRALCAFKLAAMMAEPVAKKYDFICSTTSLAF